LEKKEDTYFLNTIIFKSCLSREFMWQYCEFLWCRCKTI